MKVYIVGVVVDVDMFLVGFSLGWNTWNILQIMVVYELIRRPVLVTYWLLTLRIMIGTP